MRVQVRDLCFDYDSRAVLRGIDLELLPGCFSVVLGRNGSGKSTLFRLLAGFLHPSRGEITIQGRSITAMGDRQRAGVLGFLPQHHRPVFPFPVEEVVLTGRVGFTFLAPTSEDRRLARQAMESIGIEHLRTRIFTELSGGEQQLVMIARVLAQNPRVLLFDEPTSHLDFVYQARVLEIISDLSRRGYTVAAILHDPNLAALYGDRFICLKNGRTLAPVREDRLDIGLLQELYGLPLEAVTADERTFFLPIARP